MKITRTLTSLSSNLGTSIRKLKICIIGLLMVLTSYPQILSGNDHDGMIMAFVGGLLIAPALYDLLCVTFDVKL